MASFHKQTIMFFLALFLFASSLCVATPLSNTASDVVLKEAVNRIKTHFASVSRQTTTTNLFTCGSSPRGSRVRKEIRDLTATELSRYRQVIRTLMTERPANPEFNPPPSFWDLLVAVHIVFRAEAHSGAYFLPWHRFFLLYIENHIRDNYFSDFTLPYWDWSSFSDAADPARSTIWNAAYIGGSNNRLGLTAGTPIPNGPFQGTFAHYLDSHPVRRGFVAGQRGSMRALVNASVLDAAIQNRVWTFGEFSDAVETAHNVVHADIGGDMFLTTTSPNDPVFYLHHTFVDKIWWERQQIVSRDEFNGDHTFIDQNGETTVFVSSNFVFQYFNLPVRTSFNQNCVTYQPYSNRANAGTAVDLDTPMAEMNVTEVCENTDMMDAERCAHGEELIEEAAAAAAESS